MSVELDKSCKEKLLGYFKNISAVPRCSGKEEKISQYLYDMAVEKGWDVEKDSISNIIIRKKGTKGYENKPAVILQGHMDMVCEKEKGNDHDFLNEGILMKQAGKWLHAEDTTLGADNGVAIAYGLAILDSKKLQHPPLEIVFTVGEETTMRGAFGLQLEKLKGKMLINLDSEEEGVITAGCAGTTHVTYGIPVEYDKEASGETYTIRVCGLTGGHSGTDIDKRRANANKILGQVLEEVLSSTDTKLISICGGTKENVIPQEAAARMFTNNYVGLEALIKKLEENLKGEYAGTDPGLTLELEKNQCEAYKAFTKHTWNTIVKAICKTKDGPIYWNNEKKMLIVSSNLGVMKTLEDKVLIVSNTRSSDEALKKEVTNEMCQLAKELGITSKVKDTSFPWEYAEKSRLRDIAIKAYNQVTGKQAKVICIHAGVECGYFVKEMKGLDAISIGPTIENVHTTKERLDIQSFFNTYEYLLYILQNI